MAVQIQNANSGHNFENIVGAKRDPITGKVSYAVIWSDNNYKSGGSWEPASNFDLLQDFDTDCDPDHKEHSEAVLGQAGRHHTWLKFFGNGLDAGTPVLLQWVQWRRQHKKLKRGAFQEKTNRQHTTQMFKGKLGEEHEHPFWLIEYPESTRCKEYGTEAQAEAEQHAMDLATMLTDLSASGDGESLSNNSGNDDQFLGGWVLQAYAGLPFVHGASGLDFKVAATINDGGQ